MPGDGSSPVFPGRGGRGDLRWDSGRRVAAPAVRSEADSRALRRVCSVASSAAFTCVFADEIVYDGTFVLI